MSCTTIVEQRKRDRRKIFLHRYRVRYGGRACLLLGRLESRKLFWLHSDTSGDDDDDNIDVEQLNPVETGDQTDPV